MILQQLENRAEVELRVFEEAKQQFHRAVAGTAAETEHGGVDAVGTLNDRLDGVGEGELHVVVRVDADLFAGGVGHGDVFFDERTNLLVIKRAVTVDDDDGFHRGLGEDFQRFVNLGIGDGADGHDVAARLVAFVVGVIDHVHRSRNLVCVGGDANAVEHALFGRQDVGFVIGLAGVGHGGELELGVVVADNAAHAVLIAKLPVAMLLAGELGLGGFVTKLHVVDAGFDGGVVNGLDEVVFEQMIINQATVADRAIQHFDLGSERHPRGIFFSFTHITVWLQETKKPKGPSVWVFSQFVSRRKRARIVSNTKQMESVKNAFIIFSPPGFPWRKWH